jgi:hypothetical protein
MLGEPAAESPYVPSRIRFHVSARGGLARWITNARRKISGWPQGLCLSLALKIDGLRLVLVSLFVRCEAEDSVLSC